MPVRRPPNARSVGGWVFAASGLLLLLMERAVAQAVVPRGDRSAFVRIVERMGDTGVALVVVAIMVLALLVWRVISMIRREGPSSRSGTGRASRDDADPIDRPSIQRKTDWGFDQNKRSATARSEVKVGGTKVELPSLDAAVTQWSMTDVGKAHSAGVQPMDALGQSPMPTQSPYRTSFNPYFRGEQADRIEVVEVADALMQAELLVQLGDPKQAMTLLSHHIRETEKPGPAAWLMLLNLYQSTGREAQYNALASGFRTLFNAEVPPWAASADVNARDLESYPQVVSRLQSLWSGSQARATLDNLLNDDRGGSRQGFSLAAYRELLFLSDILDIVTTLEREDDDQDGIRKKLGAYQG